MLPKRNIVKRIWQEIFHVRWQEGPRGGIIDENGEVEERREKITREAGKYQKKT
jgi:hypothetical protein